MGFSKQEYWSGVPLPSLANVARVPQYIFVSLQPVMLPICIQVHCSSSQPVSHPPGPPISVRPELCILVPRIVTLRLFPPCYTRAGSTNWRGQRPCSVLTVHLPKCLASSPANSRHSINTCWSISERLEWSISNSKHHLGARWLNRWILQPFFNSSDPAFAAGSPMSEPPGCRALFVGWLLADFPGPRCSGPFSDGQGIHQWPVDWLFFFVLYDPPAKKKKKKKKQSTVHPPSRAVSLSLRILEDWTSTNFQLLYLYFKIYIHVIKSVESVMTRTLGNSDPELRTWTLVSHVVWMWSFCSDAAATDQSVSIQPCQVVGIMMNKNI